MGTLRYPVTVRHTLIAFALAAASLAAHAARGADDIQPLSPAPPNASVTLNAMNPIITVRVKFNNGWSSGSAELRNGDAIIVKDLVATYATNEEDGEYFIYDLGPVSGDYPNEKLRISAFKMIIIDSGPPPETETITVTKEFDLNVDDPRVP